MWRRWPTGPSRWPLPGPSPGRSAPRRGRGPREKGAAAPGGTSARTALWAVGGLGSSLRWSSDKPKPSQNVAKCPSTLLIFMMDLGRPVCFCCSLLMAAGGRVAPCGSPGMALKYAIKPCTEGHEDRERKGSTVSPSARTHHVLGVGETLDEALQPRGQPVVECGGALGAPRRDGPP